MVIYSFQSLREPCSEEHAHLETPRDVTDDCGFDLVYWFYNGESPKILPCAQVKVPLPPFKYVTSDEVDTAVLIVGKEELVRVHPNLWVAAGKSDVVPTLCLLPACTPPSAAEVYMSAIIVAWRDAQDEIELCKARLSRLEKEWLWLGDC